VAISITLFRLESELYQIITYSLDVARRSADYINDLLIRRLIFWVDNWLAESFKRFRQQPVSRVFICFDRSQKSKRKRPWCNY